MANVRSRDSETGEVTVSRDPAHRMVGGALIQVTDSDDSERPLNPSMLLLAPVLVGAAAPLSGRASSDSDRLRGPAVATARFRPASECTGPPGGEDSKCSRFARQGVASGSFKCRVGVQVRVGGCHWWGTGPGFGSR